MSNTREVTRAVYSGSCIMIRSPSVAHYHNSHNMLGKVLKRSARKGEVIGLNFPRSNPKA